MKYVIDTSSLIDLRFDVYPPDVFPSLYKLLTKVTERIIILDEIHAEIEENSKYKGVLEWLSDEMKIDPYPTRRLAEVSRMEEDYEAGAGNGASVVDIRLIAFPKYAGFDCKVVTSEGNQKTPPKEPKHYKIPLICRLEGVECIDLLSFLRENRIKV